MNAPAPLTPVDCDLQDFPFMPLQVARLRDSDLANEAHPEACWYAVMLWSASWHQLPAGSLPDNEAILAKLCGLGRDVRTFRKHRTDAMRGFVRCSDGRFYHPVVAEQALAAWTRKLQQRWRTELARIKKANQRNGTEIDSPSFDEFVAALSLGTQPGGPSRVPGDIDKCPSGLRLQETGTGTGIEEKEANASSVSELVSNGRGFRDRSYSAEFEEAWRVYPHHKGRSSKPNAQTEFDRLPPAERLGLTDAIRRFVPNVGEACGGKGAPDMAAWLKAGKHLNWAVGESGVDPSPEVWAALVDLWRAGDPWPTELGPHPDQPNTRVPRELLIRSTSQPKAAA